MNCREFADFLDLYFEGLLPDFEREEFDSHLEICPACRAYLDGYRKTVLTLRSLAAEAVESASVPDELIRAVLAARVSVKS